MKGILLAGGNGTRLYPITLATSKQLLPVYDKPMIYYPLSVLMMAGIKDILVISTPLDIDNIKRLLGDGSNFGIKLQYAIQYKPEGIAQAFIIGKNFIGNDTCAMILGDNIFYGAGLINRLKNSVKLAENGKASIFAYYVNDPQRFGIVDFDENLNVKSIEEKPTHPKTNYCVTGLYFYPKGVYSKASKIKPSNRGELEITALNNIYLEEKSLIVNILGRGFSWIDAGTHDSLVEASEYIKILEYRQGIKVCCPEEIAYINGWIDKEKLLNIGNIMKVNDYGKHLINVAKGKIKY